MYIMCITYEERYNMESLFFLITLILDNLKQVLGAVAGPQSENKLLLAVIARRRCQAVVEAHRGLRRLEAGGVACHLLVLVAEQHQVSEREMEHLPTPLSHLCLLVVGVKAGFPHHVASLVVDRRLRVGQAEEWVDAPDLLREGNFRRQSRCCSTWRGGRGRGGTFVVLNPLDRLLPDRRVHLPQHWLGEVLTVVELGKIFNKFLRRHLPLLKSLVVKVGVEQHDGASQGVHSVVGLESVSFKARIALKEPAAEV